jgi:DNA-binding HxlR family transcriptional regulator
MALYPEDRLVLMQLGQDWRFFNQISVYGMTRQQVKNRLISLKMRGYVDTRRNDIYNRVEYALTEKGWQA